MSVIYIVLPLAFVIAGAGVWAFVRAARGGQFDDLDTPAVRVVTDDDPLPPGATDASHSTRR